MNEFDEVCLEYFLAHQEQLLPEPAWRLSVRI